MSECEENGDLERYYEYKKGAFSSILGGHGLLIIVPSVMMLIKNRSPLKS